jgi:PAS domain S-box-containing protein
LRSIAAKYALFCGFLALCLVAVGGFRAWQSSRKHVEQLSRQQAALGLEFDLAIRQYVQEHIRPAMAKAYGRDVFLVETMSTSYVAREIFHRVREEFPEAVLKFSSTNPRNPSNQAGPEERQLLEEFRRDPERKQWAGRVRMNGREYFAHLRPRKLEQGCLRCHGRPEDAPPALIEKYGSSAGFGQQVGDIVAMDTVAIPLESTWAAVNADFMGQLVWLLPGAGLMMVALVLAFRSLVTRRLRAITMCFRDACRQEDPSQIRPIRVRSRDEIGRLVEAFNALAGKLRSTHEQLEQHVEDRTQELAVTNEQLSAEILRRRQAELGLREQQRQLSTLLSNLPGMAYRRDGSDAMAFEFVSQGCHALLGYTPEQLIEGQADGQKLDMIHPEDLSIFETTLKRSLRRKQPFHVLYRVIVASGVTKWLLDQGVVIEGPGGKLSIEGFVTDITDRKRAEQHALRAQQEAEAASQAKSQFLANMSHEMRTPLAGLVGMLDLMEETDLSGEQQKLFGLARSSADALQAVIGDILDFSKIEAGKLEIHSAPFNLKKVIDNTTGLMRFQAAQRDLYVRQEICDRIPDHLVGDASRVRQILLNLVGNAVKFTQTGGITVTAELDGDGVTTAWIHLIVSDTGCGISAEDQKRIFDPFEQGDSTAARNHSGTGLGLAICTRLVERMGGKMWLHSQPGQGSAFHLSLPLPVAHAHKQSPEPGGGADRKDLPGALRILLAEDNAINQLLARKLLARDGHEVTAVSNGREAVEAIETGRFDLVLMDVQMPEMDGLEATRTIRAMASGICDVPIVAMTAHALSSDRDRCLEAGMDAFVTKPVRPEVLQQGIGEALAAREGIES